MAKVTLDNVTSGLGAVSTINTNMDRIEVAMEKTLSRDGSTPNQMEAPLDMNGQRIINLPDAVSEHEPVTLGQAAEIAGVENPLTQEAVGAVLFPESAQEAASDETVVEFIYDNNFHVDPRRFGELGTVNDHDVLQAAINVASELGNGAEVMIPEGDFTTTTLNLDCSGIKIRGVGRGSILRAHDDIPTNGAILLSLAGEAANQTLLDSIYGVGVQSDRSVVTGSLEDVSIQNLRFISSSETIRGIWMTGFTRGCDISYCRFQNFKDYGVALNGSWSFAMRSNHVIGDGTNGVGFGFGIAGNGTRDGASVVNVPMVSGNELKGCQDGFVWDFGRGGALIGNTCETNARFGFKSQAASGWSWIGGYMEANGTDNMRLGGTNGTDFCVGCVVVGTFFNNSTGENICLQSVRDCVLGPISVSGAQTRYFLISTSGTSDVDGCSLYVPAISGTYIGNSGTLDLDRNWVYETDVYETNMPNLIAHGAFRHVGTEFGIYGHAVATQPAAITDASTSHALNSTFSDVEVEAALNALGTKINSTLAALRAWGGIAT